MCFSGCFFHCILVLFSVHFFVLVPFVFYICFPLVVVLFFAVLFLVVFGCFFRAFFRVFFRLFFVFFLCLLSCFFSCIFSFFLVLIFVLFLRALGGTQDKQPQYFLHFGPCVFWCFFWWSLLVKIGYTQYIYMVLKIYINIIYISPRACCFLLHPPPCCPSVFHLFNGFVGAFGVFFLRTKHCSSLWRWMFPAKFVSVSMNSVPFEEKKRVHVEFEGFEVYSL